MSAERSKNAEGVGYTPSTRKLPKDLPTDQEAPPKEPTMTASQYQSQQLFFREQVQSFKELFEDSTLAKWIVMAGISGLVAAVLEALHMIWLAARYVWKF
jgi:hypothetical protein